jgi:hypothetical protein
VRHGKRQSDQTIGLQIKIRQPKIKLSPPKKIYADKPVKRRTKPDTAVKIPPAHSPHSPSRQLWETGRNRAKPLFHRLAASF